MKIHSWIPPVNIDHSLGKAREVIISLVLFGHYVKALAT